MGLKQTIDALFNNSWRPDTTRQIVLPAGAVGTQTAVGGAAFVYGVWNDQSLAAAVLLDSLIVAVSFDLPSVLEQYTVDIGSCLVGGVNYANAAAVIAAGAAVIAAASRQEIRQDFITLVGSYGIVQLHSPIFIPAGVGIIARNYSVGGGDTVGVTVHLLQNFA